MSDRCLLHDILHCAPPRSSRHSLALTIWLLALDRSDQEEGHMYHCFVNEIKKGRWRIDRSLLRFLIRNGDSDTRLDLLTCSMTEFLTFSERRSLFLKEFKIRKSDEWSMMVLSEVLNAMILSVEGKGFRHAEQFRHHIDFFVRHPSFRVHRFGIMSAVLLNPPDRTHLQALKNGLFHSNDSLRLYSVTALHLMFEKSESLSETTIELIRSVGLVEALSRFAKQHRRFSANIKLLNPHFLKFGLSVAEDPRRREGRKP